MQTISRNVVLSAKFLMVIVAVFVVLGMVDTVSAYPIHDLTYSNSPYLNKHTPSLGTEIEFLYQAYDENSSKSYFEVTVSITDLDEHKNIFFEKHQLDTGSSENPHDIFWNFVPEKSGLYVVEVLDKSEKYKRYFAVPEDDGLKRVPVTNPELLKDTSPRKQFRMGIDPKLVICDGALFLALTKDNQPVCLTLDTLIELRERRTIVAENIDYERIGLLYSENEFKSILEEKNIEYAENNYVVIAGGSLLSLPPKTGYCGYVLDNEKEDYWFSSSYAFPTFTSRGLTDENPNPCKPNSHSCECGIQLSLAEKNTKQLSYYDEAETMRMGSIFRDYLNEGNKIANVPNLFTIGKYNLEMDPDVATFCGQFQGNAWWHFQGHVKDDVVIGFSLEEKERPVLCAIDDDPVVFEFEKSAIKVQSFN